LNYVFGFAQDIEAAEQAPHGHFAVAQFGFGAAQSSGRHLCSWR
jgi:hypothetical protein